MQLRPQARPGGFSLNADVSSSKPGRPNAGYGGATPSQPALNRGATWTAGGEAQPASNLSQPVDGGALRNRASAASGHVSPLRGGAPQLGGYGPKSPRLDPSRQANQNSAFGRSMTSGASTNQGGGPSSRLYPGIAFGGKDLEIDAGVTGAERRIASPQSPTRDTRPTDGLANLSTLQGSGRFQSGTGGSQRLPPGGSKPADPGRPNDTAPSMRDAPGSSAMQSRMGAPGAAGGSSINSAPGVVGGSTGSTPSQMQNVPLLGGVGGVAASGGADRYSSAGMGGSGTYGGPASTSFRSNRAAPEANRSAAAVAEMQAKVKELESQNAELNKRLDADGEVFLEALVGLEKEVEDLQKVNRKLMEDREQIESQLGTQGSDGEQKAKVLRLERERQDMLNQMDEFEREKDEEISSQMEMAEKLRRQLAEYEQSSKRRISDLERERESMIEQVSIESQELQKRIDKLERDKAQLNTDLARALARAEANGASSGPGVGEKPRLAEGADELFNQLRTVTAEREALKDEVTNKAGQIVHFQTQLEIKERKLRLADMENAMLKSELESLRRGQGR